MTRGFKLLTHLQMWLARAAAALASVWLLIITVMLILTHVLLLGDRLTCCNTVLAALAPVSKVSLGGPLRVVA